MRSHAESAGSSWTRSRRSSGWSRSRVAARDELDRRHRAGVMVRVTAGRRGAHPRIHRDRPRGPEVRLLDHQRRRLAGRTPRARGPGPRAARPALPHRLPDLRLLGVRGRRPPGAGAPGPDQRGARREPARARPRRRLRHRLHHPGRPRRPRAAGHRDDQDRRARVPGPRHPRAAALDRAGPRDRRARDVHRLHRGHRQAGRPRRGSGAHLRQRRRRHERQHPHRPLRRRLLLHPGVPAPAMPRPCSPAWSASTARPATSW